MKSFNQYIVERHDGNGDCMEAAAKLMMKFYTSFYGKQLKAKGSPVLVHALVYGQGAVKGLRFPHAWVEDAGEVIDQSNGRDIRMSKTGYYATGRIDPKQKGAYVVYSFSDMKDKLRKTKHYGPWDLDEKLEEAKVPITSKSGIGKRRKRVDPKILDALSEGIVTTGAGMGAGVRALAGVRAPAGVPVTWNDLKRLEGMLDAMFRQAGLDIAFTRHFHERINGSRGYGGTVSIPELQDAFRKTYAKYAAKIKNHDVDWKAVILDVSKTLNMPFVLKWDDRARAMSLVMVTAMKKPDFKSPDPKLPV